LPAALALLLIIALNATESPSSRLLLLEIAKSGLQGAISQLVKRSKASQILNI
jgi:hypothetical protein